MKGTEATQRYSYPCPYTTSIAATIVGTHQAKLPQTTPISLIESAYKVSISPQTAIGTLYCANGTICVIYDK